MASRLRRPNPSDVFLNFAFDDRREYLYLSLIASLVCLGLNPRTVLEVPVDADRLRRLAQLIRSGRYSIHDLSAVQVTTRPNRVPRFNMPFELGLAASLQLKDPTRHGFRLLEAVRYRLQQSLSDLNGYDPYIRREEPEGVFDAVLNMFAEIPSPPLTTQAGFAFVFDTLRRSRRAQGRVRSPYTAVQFGRLVTVARGAVEQVRP